MTREESHQIQYLLEQGPRLSEEESAWLKAFSDLGENSKDKSILRAAWLKRRAEAFTER
jgi:hypothetical protein